MPSRASFTRADLERLPEDWRVELHEGVLVMVPSAVPFHEGLSVRLMDRLLEYLGPDGGGRRMSAPTDVVIDDETVLQPDVLVLPEGDAPKPPPWVMPTPVWVAEILSPSTSARDRETKPRLYAKGGVREMWILDPEAKTIDVLDLATGRTTRAGPGDRATSAELPGFAVDVDSFFAA